MVVARAGRALNGRSRNQDTLGDEAVGWSRSKTCLGAILAGCVLLAGNGAARAEGETGPPALVGILPGQAAEASLSLSELRGLPWRTIRTRNPFNDTEVAYSGPLMRDVLAALGLEGAAKVRCVALNDYSVDIPTSDFAKWDVIIAMEADGTPLSPRETGPLWIIYPQTGRPELVAPEIDQRLIWQLVRIEAL